jgi:hypothetical protein
LLWLIRFLSLLGFDISNKVHAEIPEHDSNYYVCFFKDFKGNMDEIVCKTTLLEQI